MATRSYVPRADGEGSIGTSVKKWLNGFFKAINIENTITAKDLNLSNKATVKDFEASGNVVVGTKTKGDNSTKAASTAYVMTALGDYAALTGATFTGAVLGVTPEQSDNSKKFATTAFIKTLLGSYAPIASPTFTGTPKSVTPAAYDKSTQIATTAWFYTFGSEAGFHNSIFRGKSLGTSVSSAQRAAITAGTFDDMFVGDYWTINGVVWRIAGFDYWYNVGDTNFTKHHVVIVPDTCLYNAQMHKTASGGYESGAVNTTEGGYLATDLYAELDTARNLVYAAFGQANVPTHRKLLPTSCTGGKYTSWAWKDSNVELMNEVMVYGTRVWGDSGNNGYSVGSQKTQLPLFRLSPRHINTRQTYWLMDVCSATTFANVTTNGIALSHHASYPLGVRPAFALI